MTSAARLMSGITLMTVPTIQYGGYFLLTSLMNRGSGYMDNALRQNFFRAGHAHAGVIVLLSLICQLSPILPRCPCLWFGSFGLGCRCLRFSFRRDSSFQCLRRTLRSRTGPLL